VRARVLSTACSTAIHAVCSPAASSSGRVRRRRFEADNNNLLLSADAHADSQPQLEIYAGRCEVHAWLDGGTARSARTVLPAQPRLGEHEPGA